MADNPYEAPSANLSGNETFGVESGGVTQGVVDQLRRTKGWTRFIGVLFIILGVVLFFLAIFGGSFISTMSRSTRGLGAFLGIILVIYGVMGVLNLVIGFKLGGFSSAVQRLMHSGQERDLEDALDRQRSFWVFVGVMMLIFLIIAIVAIIAGVVTQF